MGNGSKKEHIKQGKGLDQRLADINIRKSNPEVVKFLQVLVDQAKSGELTGFTIVQMWHGNNINSATRGISTDYIRTVVGEMEIQKQEFIKHYTDEL